MKMKINVTHDYSNYVRRLPEGFQAVIITDVVPPKEAVSNAGNQVMVTDITFTSEENPNHLTQQKTWVHTNPNSFFMKVIEAAKIESDDEGNIDLDDLIGKRIQVEVKLNGKFLNVVDALPIEDTMAQ